MPMPSAQPIAIHGAPLDPALGMPRAVIYLQRWAQWLEVAFGLGAVALFAAMMAGLVSATDRRFEYTVLSWFFIVLSPFLIVDGIRRLRGRPALIVAEHGFDDRTSFRAIGPVLWSEVASIGPGTKWLGNRRQSTIVVVLKPGKRAPLSPLGPMPKQADKAEILLGRGTGQKIQEAMAAAYSLWRDRQIYGG